MVRTRTTGSADGDDDAINIDAAIANALNTLFPGLTTPEMMAQVVNNIRNQTGASGSGGGNQPTGIHTWLERFGKLKPLSFSTAATPTEAEDWITHIEKLFEVLGCGDEFKTRLAAFKLEGDALNWWKALKQARGGDAFAVTCT